MGTIGLLQFQRAIKPQYWNKNKLTLYKNNNKIKKKKENIIWQKKGK